MAYGFVHVLFDIDRAGRPGRSGRFELGTRPFRDIRDCGDVDRKSLVQSMGRPQTATSSAALPYLAACMYLIVSRSGPAQATQTRDTAREEPMHFAHSCQTVLCYRSVIAVCIWSECVSCVAPTRGHMSFPSNCPNRESLNPKTLSPKPLRNTLKP